MRRMSFIALAAIAPSLCLWSCSESKSSTPLSPSIAGPIAGVQITQPGAVAPTNNAQIASDTQPITLTVNNATTSGVRPLSYAFEISTDSGFGSKVFTQSGVAPGNGQTSLRLPQNLSSDHYYYWRVKAYDGANTSDYSAPLAFTVFTPVVIGKPGVSSPADKSVTTTTTPILEVLNPPVTGPAGQMSILFELAADSTFASPIVHVPVLAGSSSKTAYGVPNALALNTRYFWHAKAFDSAGHTGDFSDVFSFTTPASATGGAGGGGGTGAPTTAPNDQLDMSQVTIAVGADIRGWAVTSTLTSVTHIGDDLCTYHTKAGKWPALPFFDDPTATVEGNQWFFANVGGKWYGGANEWLRPGQVCKGVTGAIGPDNFGNSPLQNWIPQPGELLGVAVSTPARSGQWGTAERSNVVLIHW